MAAPATHESKPGSAARDVGDGHARNARRVTGPLAGAVLGPTVCGGCERGQWHRTTSTTGLFQRDGGWFRLGSGVLVTEEGLIEGVDAGVDGVDPARPFSRPSLASVCRDKRVNRAMPAPRAPRRPPRVARPQQREMPPRASVHTQSCSDAGNRLHHHRLDLLRGFLGSNYYRGLQAVPRPPPGPHSKTRLMSIGFDCLDWCPYLWTDPTKQPLR